MDELHRSNQSDDFGPNYQAEQRIIAQLQQRVASQEYQLQEQSHHIQQLESQLAEAQQSLARIPQFAEQFSHLKNELAQLKAQQGQQPHAAAMPNQAITMQLDSYSLAIKEIRRELDKMHRYDEQLALARNELERLNKGVNTFQASLDNLTRQLDERVRPMTYLEEQRRIDTQRLAEVQTELPDLRKKLETNLAKIQMVEQQIPQFGKYELALEEMRNDIRQYREHMDFQAAQRERQTKNWTELAEAQERRMGEFESVMEKYAQHYQLNKRALASLQDFQERLQREQHQAEELHRLTEQRHRTMIEKWQGDYEQRWQKQVMEWQPHLADLQKSIDNLKEQIDKIVKFNETVDKQIMTILQIIEEDIQTKVVAAQEWQQRFEDLANGQF